MPRMVWQAKGNTKVLALSLLGLAVFLSWQALALRSYARADQRPPAWDQAIHLEIAHDYRVALKEGRLGDVVSLAPKPGMPPFPPLYHLLVAKVYDERNPAGSALWVNWFYFALMCLAIFGISYHFRPDETALAAVIGFACTPGMMDLYTTQLVDLAVVAWSAAAFWLLLKTDEFRSWGYSIAFGVCFAVGMMHKWSFFSYMIPAYLLGLKALGERKSRLPALASLAVALLLCGPWYFVHLPVLVPRLFQASSDFAVPVWKGGAFFNYLLQSTDSFGPLFWGLGWVALLAAQPRRYVEQFWLTMAWVGCSYVFWAIVPNRQMRFLLPGMPGLAVCAAMAWPGVLLWGLAAVQAFTAANFTSGWISPITVPLPFVTFRVLPSDPPKNENWQMAEILKEAERRAEGEPANLTLIANAQRFNGPTMTWLRKELGLKKVRVRGVNKRLCEFSQFVVLKEGDLGPPSVIGGLAEAAKAVQDKSGWFRKGYDEAARYPLPDGSAAVLYMRKRLTAPQFKQGKLPFQFYENGHVRATNMKVELGGFDAAQGVYPLARLNAESVTVRGLQVARPSVEFHDLAMVSTSKDARSEWDDVRLLKLGRLVIKSGEITAEGLKTMLEQRVKNLKIRTLSLEQGVLRAEASLSNIALTAAVRPELKPDGLTLHLLDARLGATPLPKSMLGPFKDYFIPFTPNPETPFHITVPSLDISGGKLVIR